MNGVQSKVWVVMKLGGTSTADPACWDNAIQACKVHQAAGRRVLIVHSALSGVTDLLERLLKAKVAERESALTELEQRHRRTAKDMGLSYPPGLPAWFQKLIAHLDAPDTTTPKSQARVLALGELMASELVRDYLSAQGLPVNLLDARDLLTSQALVGQSEAGHYLSAVCEEQGNQPWVEGMNTRAGVVLTQGFIARDSAGDTVVLGRGGSDTSAAYLAAGLGAMRLEIWTDVPGLFSANPHDVSGARLLQHLDYTEAQEIATTGAKVLHPRCIGPARRHNIPVRIVYAPDPSLPGTTISADTAELGGRVKAIPVRRGVTLVSMETVGMWHQVGFLADAFACFKRHGLSIDMVSTSETSVTVTLDPLVNPQANEVLAALLDDLRPLCRARAVNGCAAISLVGRNVRANLHRLAPALELFEERRVHLVSQAANDLNLTFVVDEADASRLVKELHASLIHKTEDDAVLGPTWEELRATPTPVVTPWWQGERKTLLDLGVKQAPLYVYHRASLQAAVNELAVLRAVDQVYYAVKANCHPAVLREFHAQGLGFECVSPGEIRQVQSQVPELDASRILFTPNFAPREDYAFGLQQGVWVTLDNLHPLQAWPELFHDRELLLRVDPGAGAGHHRHVRTAGSASKFGIAQSELGEARRLADKAGARIVGLHMHLGSGILDAAVWLEQGLRLAQIAADFNRVRLLDLGGGLGISEKPGDPALDLQALNQALQEVKQAAPPCELWLEPGRFLVARAGVLLTRVTQLKGKGEVRYVGADTGMNSLIRPALYGAHHPIVNLSRLEEPASGTFNVVGPICETGDVLGRERRLPEPREGDVLLIANAGAYGHVMASRYNLRTPASEIVIC